MKFRWLLSICLALMVGGVWLHNMKDALPSTKFRTTSASLKPNHTILSSEMRARARSIITPAVPWGISQPYSESTNCVDVVIPLPDIRSLEDLKSAGSGDTWRLANMSSIIHKKRSGNDPPSMVEIATAGNATAVSKCSPLCGNHGWGECKQGTCICPVLYNGTDCLTVRDLPTRGPLANLPAKYVGEISISRRSLAGEKWFTAFFPERVKEKGRGFQVIGPITRKFTDALPEKDILAPGKVCSSCSIVGSSGSLLTFKLGSKINEAECIVRFNRAPSKGYEEHVGSGTQIRLTDSQSWGFFEHYSETVLAPLRSRTALDALTRVRQRFAKMQLGGMNPEFLHYVASAFDFVPSLGMMGIVLGLQRCHRVTLYGFHMHAEQNVTHHYYDPCARPTDVVRDKKEYAVVNSMAKIGLLTFGEPCVQVCHDKPQKCRGCRKSHAYKAPVANATHTCPPCSFTPKGCLKNRHWAFRTGRQWVKMTDKRLKRRGKKGVGTMRSKHAVGKGVGDEVGEGGVEGEEGTRKEEGGEGGEKDVSESRGGGDDKSGGAGKAEGGGEGSDGREEEREEDGGAWGGGEDVEEEDPTRFIKKKVVWPEFPGKGRRKGKKREIG